LGVGIAIGIESNQLLTNRWRNIAITLMTGIVSVIAFYEKVIKVKADVAAYLINCFPSA
jgi:hypothetical protein